MKNMLAALSVAAMVFAFTGMSFAQAKPAVPAEKSGKAAEEKKEEGKAKAKAKAKSKAEEKKAEATGGK